MKRSNVIRGAKKGDVTGGAKRDAGGDASSNGSTDSSEDAVSEGSAYLDEAINAISDDDRVSISRTHFLTSLHFTLLYFYFYLTLPYFVLFYFYFFFYFLPYF